MNTQNAGCCSWCACLIVALLVLLGMLLCLPGSIVGLVLEAGVAHHAPRLPVVSTDTAGTVRAPTPTGAAAASKAEAIAAHLFGIPDVFYDAGLPSGALAFWQRVCPSGTGCWLDWQNGNLQCVELITAAYVLAGDPLPVSGNAVDYWGLYADRAGWQEIPAGSGLPAPGDILVWSDAPQVGHVAIVTSVLAPTRRHAGFVTFAQANGPSPLETQVLLPNLTVHTWDGYQVLGVIRATG